MRRNRVGSGRDVTRERVKRLFEGGLTFFAEQQGEVDRLNVFLVLDGDTGRNMYLTMAAAVKELQKIDSLSLCKVREVLSRGSLIIRGLVEVVTFN